MDDNGGLLDLQAFKRMISHLDEEDLVILNRLIVERTKLVRAEKKVQSMAAFEVGDAVFFHDKNDGRIDATVLRLNKKTLSLVTDDGQRWNVAPELCRIDNPVADDLFQQQNSHESSNVTMLPTASAQTVGKGRWYGGAVEMPAYVTEEGQSYRPFVMLWIDADGLIAATEVCPPEADLKQVALETLQQAMQSPMTGQPQRPKYITVNDRDLASFLDSRVPGINIEYGDTPILNEVVDNFGNTMPPGDTADTYLTTGLTAGQISSFFDAATKLYLSSPWDSVPHDACLLSVTLESHGIHNAVLSVIGQMGESFGIVLYASFQHFSEYQIASDRMRRDLDYDIPPHTALSFDDGAQVSTSIRKEIAEHGWQVANTSSYPVIFTLDRDNLLRPLAAADVAVFEALSRALPTVLKNHSKLIQGWNGENVFRKKVMVDSIGDQVAVEISAPYPFEKGYASKDDPSDTTMVQLALLAHTADEPDAGTHNELCEALHELFFESPEGKKCPDGPSIATLLMHFAFVYQSATIATLQAGPLEEVVFEIVPQKVMAPADRAKAIIEECRLFYRFLKRQYALPQADHCLEVLGGDAIKRLKAALADDSGFGPGKGAIASGLLPGTTTGKPVDKQDKKRKRKAAKKSRKKNR